MVMVPFAAIVAGESRLGVLAADLLGFSAATDGLTLGALQTEGDDVLLYFPSCPK